ncbi:MAG: penicillin-binding protein 2 [Candidatus Omnitrophota bacterium]|nr:penicillin-binding protein 2 [Candidatus Omnitrophota bacterium]
MRLRILQRVVFAGLVIIWTGLFTAQVIQGNRYHRQSEKNRTRLIHLPAARGAILDRNGIPLAEDRITFELAALPQELTSPQETWKELSPLVGVPPEELSRRYKKNFQAKFSPVALVRSLPRETAFRLEEERGRLPGILIRPVPERSYPLGAAVGGVTGYLGLIAPEELTKLKTYGYTVRDRVGKDGLEQQYDALLRGKDGGLHLEVNAQGKLVQQLGFLQPQSGRGIKVSIDARLQEAAYRLMQGGEGAALVMDCKTGELLCLVSSPAFDPNAFMDPARQAQIRSMLRDPERPMFNRATRAAVPPGSTFKAAVAYEALKRGKISPETSFDCRGGLYPGRPVFRCWEEQGHGPQTVLEGLQHSCNVFFYNTGRRLGVAGIAEVSRLFGLGKKTGIDLPREAVGLVPDAEWMRRRMKLEWQEGDTLSLALGQSALQTTPLQMGLLFSAIASGGWVPTPHLLLDPPSRIRKGIQLRLNASALATVKEGLERVVNTDTGTGRLARLPNTRVAAKTGTAQVSRGRSHAWFCGYAPAESPKYSFVIFLEHGGKGGLHAARVASGLLVLMKEMGYL